MDELGYEYPSAEGNVFDLHAEEDQLVDMPNEAVALLRNGALAVRRGLWWKDKDVLENIPEVFTLDMDQTYAANSPEVARALEGPQFYQDFFDEMCKRYKNPRFCISTTNNWQDFSFYTTLKWGRKDTPNDRIQIPVEPGNTQGPWTVISCIGRDDDLSKFNPLNKMHFLVPPALIKTRGYPNEIYKEAKNGLDIRAFAPDDPSAAHFSSLSGGVIRDLASPENMNLARRYLSDCMRSHGRCQERDYDTKVSDFRPSRLLDVGAEGQKFIRLVASEGLANGISLQSGGYVALSYCWGKGQPQRTTSLNSTTRLSVTGFPLDSQPATIQDAAQVTRALGMRYIWIDSLCIIQDDADDVAREIAQMDRIYQHATLLISASRAENSDQGFLRSIDEDVFDQVELDWCIPLRYRSKGTQGYVLLEKWMQSDGGNRVHWANREWMNPYGNLEPIDLRAWTLQEHVVSTRVLAFGSTGMRWECLCQHRFGLYHYESRVHHDNPIKLSSKSTMPVRKSPAAPVGIIPELVLVKDDPSTAGFDFEDPREEWECLRDRFACRDITKPADRLPAISAVAKQFLAAFGCEKDYLAGHWRSHLPRDLLWAERERPYARPMEELDASAQRDRDDPFPTWSWASTAHARMGDDFLVASIRFFNESPAYEVAVLLQADIALANPADPFGDVLSGKLLLQARMLPILFALKWYQETGIVFCSDEKVYLPKFRHHAASTLDKKNYRLDINLDRFYSQNIDEEKFKREWGSDNDLAITDRSGTHVLARPSGLDLFLVEIVMRPYGGTELYSGSVGLLLRRRVNEQGNQEYVRYGVFRLDVNWDAVEEDPAPFLTMDKPMNPFDHCGFSRLWLV